MKEVTEEGWNEFMTAANALAATARERGIQMAIVAQRNVGAEDCQVFCRAFVDCREKTVPRLVSGVANYGVDRFDEIWDLLFKDPHNNDELIVMANNMAYIGNKQLQRLIASMALQRMGTAAAAGLAEIVVSHRELLETAEQRTDYVLARMLHLPPDDIDKADLLASIKDFATGDPAGMDGAAFRLSR